MLASGSPYAAAQIHRADDMECAVITCYLYMKLHDY